jgi:tetratricopeptide (TPR) repeat protein
MATPIKFNATQKERFQRLAEQLQRALCGKNLEAAKKIVFDIQELLKSLGQVTKLVEIKNSLFELSMDNGDYNYAERGLIGNRQLVNKNTRVHLEATALLAICYLRQNDLEKAKPLIQEVLKNDKVIKSPEKRIVFRASIIQRFDEEAVLYSLRAIKTEHMDNEEIYLEVDNLLKTTKSAEDIYTTMGRSLPEFSKNTLLQIDEYSKKLLPSADRKMLPSPIDAAKDTEAGKTILSSFKRVVYDSLCDPKSEIYKAWYTNGLAVTLDKKFLISAMVASLSGIGIGLKALAVSAAALAIRFGLDVYCNHNKPVSVMAVRKVILVDED